MREALIVAKYLVKNYIVNPFLKKFKKIALYAVLCAVLGGVVAAALSLVTPPPEGVEVEEPEEPFHVSFRRALTSLGINKYVAIDALSLVLTLALVATALKGRAALMVMEEAEYEVLLAHPITMAAYVVGRSLLSFVQVALLSLFYVFMFPMVYDLSGGSLAKALLFPVALVLLYAFLSFATQLITSLKAVLRGKEKYLELATYAYVAAGAAHSLVTQRVSPLLTLPTRLVAEPLVYCVTIAETWQFVVAEVAAGTLLVGGVVTALLGLSRWLHPEFVRPVSEVLREGMARRRRSLPMYSPSPARAVLNQVFVSRVASPGHLRNVGVGIATAALCGYLVNAVVVPRFGAFPTELGLSTALLGLVTAELVASLAANALAQDLVSMWVYRVYVLDLAPLAASLLLRYVVYFFEAFLAVSVFSAAVSGRPTDILFPVVALPVDVLMSFLLLALLSYIASKRRVVRQAPTGLYVLEELGMLAVFAVVVPLVTLSDLAFKLLLGRHAAGALLATACATSLALSCLLFWLASHALADLMGALDIVS